MGFKELIIKEELPSNPDEEKLEGLKELTNQKNECMCKYDNARKLIKKSVEKVKSDIVSDLDKKFLTPDTERDNELDRYN